MMPSRCQSYTTLPRPEHGPELLDDHIVSPFNKSQPQIIYGTRADGILQIPFRPPSARSASRSLGRKNSTAAPLPPAYFGASGGIFGGGHPAHIEIGEYGIGGELDRAEGAHHKEVVPWSTVSLSSWLTVR